MFTERGIKSVTMDEISAALSISKRTLYEEFKSKNELVEETVFEKNIQFNERNEEICRAEINAIEKIFLVASINGERNKENRIFFQDIIKNYPTLVDKLITRFQQSNIDLLLKNIEQGCNENLFYKDINHKIAIELLIVIRTSFQQKTGKRPLDFDELHTFSMIFFLRSISTQEGLDIINNLCKTNNINIFK